MNGSTPKKPGKPTQPLTPPREPPPATPSAPATPPSPEDTLESRPTYPVSTPGVPEPSLPLPPPAQDAPYPPAAPAPPFELRPLEDKISRFQQDLLKKLHPKPGATVNTRHYRANLLALEAFKALLSYKSLATEFHERLSAFPGALDPVVETFLGELLPGLPDATLNATPETNLPVLEVDASGLMRGGLKGEKLWNDATAGGRFTGSPHGQGLRLATEHPTTRDLIKAGGLFEYWRAGEMRHNLEKMRDSVESLKTMNLSRLRRLGCDWATPLGDSPDCEAISEALWYHFGNAHVVFTNGGGAGHKAAADAVRAHVNEEDSQNLTVVQPLAVIYALWLWSPRKVDWILTDSLSSQTETAEGQGNHYHGALDHICNYILKSPPKRPVRALPYTTLHYWDHPSSHALESSESRHPVSTLLHLFAAQTRSRSIPPGEEGVGPDGIGQTRWSFPIRPTLRRRTQTFLLGLFRHPSHVGFGFRKAARDMNAVITYSENGDFSVALAPAKSSSKGAKTTLWQGRLTGDAPGQMCAPAPDAADLLRAPLPTTPVPDYYTALQTGEEKQTNSKRCPPALNTLLHEFRETCLLHPEHIRRAPDYTVERSDGPDHELVNVEILNSANDGSTQETTLSGMQLRGGGATVAELVAWRDRDEAFFTPLADPPPAAPAGEATPVRTVNYATMGSSPGYQQVVDYVANQLQTAARHVTASGRPLRVSVVPLGFMDNRTVIPTLGLMSRSEVTLDHGCDEHHVIPLCGRTEDLLIGDKRLEPFCLDLAPSPPGATHPSSLIGPLPGATLSEESVHHIKRMFPFLDSWSPRAPALRDAP